MMWHRTVITIDNSYVASEGDIWDDYYGFKLFVIFYSFLLLWLKELFCFITLQGMNNVRHNSIANAKELCISCTDPSSNELDGTQIEYNAWAEVANCICPHDSVILVTISLSCE